MINSKAAQAICLIAFTFAVMELAPCPAQWEGREEILADVEKTFGDPPGMIRLDRKGRVWADKKNRRVAVDGYIALRAGQLEMLACLVGTKEHESIFAVFSDAQSVHAGLLAVGAKQGEPVKWDPVYQAPTGSPIQVTVLWKDANGQKRSADARTWVRKMGDAEKTLDVPFVFAGSRMWKDPDTGEEKYLAEGGDLICVSNFSTATLDVPMDSSQANSGLMFMAFTERIPERGTPVRLILQVIDPPAADARPQASNIPAAEPATEPKGEPQPSDPGDQSDPAGEQPVE